MDGDEEGMMDELIEQAVEKVEEMCEPKKMPSKKTAVDFLEGVIERLQSSVEALREEIENAE
jgi:hypothetical protein